MALTDRDRAILDFEGRWYRRAGAKEEAVRVELGLTSTRYYQLVNRLIDNSEALAHAPVVVARLRRLRAARQRARAARSLGISA